jgi:hypothetical protein
MRNIAIIDETFDGELTPAYHLSIRYSDQFCSFAIMDGSRLKFIAYKIIWFAQSIPAENQADHIRSILHGESYLTRKYQSVNLVYLTPVSVLVPSSLFRKENPEVYLKFSAPLRSTDRILFRKIPSIDAFSVFPIPADFFNQIVIMLHEVQVFHQSCTQIEAAITASGGDTGYTSVIVGVNSGFADILIIKAKQVLLYNSFTIRDTNDLVFYILYMYEQFGLSQETCPLEIAGFIEMYTGAVELLSQYLIKIVFQKFPDSYTYSDNFSELTQHHITPIINLTRCE